MFSLSDEMSIFFEHQQYSFEKFAIDWHETIERIRRRRQRQSQHEIDDNDIKRYKRDENKLQRFI